MREVGTMVHSHTYIYEDSSRPRIERVLDEFIEGNAIRTDQLSSQLQYRTSCHSKGHPNLYLNTARPSYITLI